MAFFLGCTILVSTSGATRFHIVKKGDTLSKLSSQFYKEKTYGSKGALAKILSLNPQIKNPHKIRLGDKIFISVPEMEKFAPAREFASMIEAASVESSESFSLFPFLGMNSIKASDRNTGGTSTVASQTNVGVLASYGIDWEDLNTSINLRLNRINFEKPIDSSISIKDRDLFLTAIGVGAYHQLSTKLGLGITAEYGSEIFVRSDATNVLAIDKVNVPSVGGSVQMKLKESRSHQLGLDFTYKSMLPAKTDEYRVKLGHEFGVGLELSKLSGGARTFTADVNVNFRNQDTSITRQSEFGVFVGVHFSFLGEGR